MIEKAIVKIVDKQDLTYDEAYEVISEIMSGKTTATQNAAFLAALSTKSTKAETIDEIAGCAAAMRDAAIKFENDDDLLEIVGTGGDNAHSFNISTTSVFYLPLFYLPLFYHLLFFLHLLYAYNQGTISWLLPYFDKESNFL